MFLVHMSIGQMVALQSLKPRRRRVRQFQGPQPSRLLLYYRHIHIFSGKGIICAYFLARRSPVASVDLFFASRGRIDGGLLRPRMCFAVQMSIGNYLRSQERRLSPRPAMLRCCRGVRISDRSLGLFRFLQMARGKSLKTKKTHAKPKTRTTKTRSGRKTRLSGPAQSGCVRVVRNRPFGAFACTIDDIIDHETSQTSKEALERTAKSLTDESKTLVGVYLSKRTDNPALVLERVATLDFNAPSSTTLGGRKGSDLKYMARFCFAEVERRGKAEYEYKDILKCFEKLEGKEVGHSTMRRNLV